MRNSVKCSSVKWRPQGRRLTTPDDAKSDVSVSHPQCCLNKRGTSTQNQQPPHENIEIGSELFDVANAGRSVQYGDRSSGVENYADFDETTWTATKQGLGDFIVIDQDVDL
jgi:hypothetical protein